MSKLTYSCTSAIPQSRSIHCEPGQGNPEPPDTITNIDLLQSERLTTHYDLLSDRRAGTVLQWCADGPAIGQITMRPRFSFKSVTTTQIDPYEDSR